MNYLRLSWSDMWLLTKGVYHIPSTDTELNLLSPLMSRKYGDILIINETSTPILNLAEICQQIHLMEQGQNCLLERNTSKISFS